MSKSNLPQTEAKAIGRHFKYVRPDAKTPSDASLTDILRPAGWKIVLRPTSDHSLTENAISHLGLAKHGNLVSSVRGQVRDFNHVNMRRDIHCVKCSS